MRHVFFVIGITACSGRDNPQPSLPASRDVAEPQVVHVSAGGGRTCAVTADERAYCWGGHVRAWRATPAAYALEHRWRNISLGLAQMGCGLTTAQQTYCWWDATGDEEPGDTLFPLHPTLMESLPPLVHVAVGETHACGLASSGTVYCWGANRSGELGRGTRSEREGPGPAGANLHSAVVVGGNTSCAVALDGTVYCWGLNEDGILGRSASEDCSDVKEWHDGPTVVLRCDPTPAPVVTELRFTSIALGGLAPCGLTGSGAVYCWAASEIERNDSLMYGQSKVRHVEHAPPLMTLSAGGYHRCGLTADGAAFCWGDNDYGQLGSGDKTKESDVPRPVAGGLVFQALSAGYRHTCGLTTGGEVYCWGSNGVGQLGDGTTQSSPVPLLVKFPPS